MDTLLAFLIVPIFLFTILNKENIFEGFENEKLYRKIFALFIGYKTKKNKKKDLQLLLRKI